MKNMCLLIFLLLSTAFSAWSQTPDAQELMREADKALYPENFSMTITLLTTQPGKRDRFLRLENIHKKGSGSFMEITEPSRSRGTRFLQKEGSLWMFNPKSGSKRAIRLSPRESFQGSAFNNNDISDTEYADDYTSEYLGEESLDTGEGPQTCHVIQGLAKAEESTYGKIVIYMRKADLVPLKMDYYSKSGLLFKTILFSDFKTLAGRIRPTNYTMRSLEKQEMVSVVTIESLILRNDLPESQFTKNALTR